MRSSWVIGSCLCLVVLAGCGGSKPTEDNYAKVKSGMTVSEVESILGRADNSNDMPANAQFGTPETSMKEWDVTGTSKKITVIFHAGKVSNKDMRG